jgi:hypothetical protein
LSMMPRVATGIRCAHRLRDPLSASAGRFLGRDNPVCALDAGTRALLGRDRGRLSAASCVRLACVMSCRQRSPGRIITLRTPAPNVIAPLKQSVTCRIHATARDVPWRALVGIRAEVRLDQHGPVERDHRGPSESRPARLQWRYRRHDRRWLRGAAARRAHHGRTHPSRSCRASAIPRKRHVFNISVQRS